jgi:predicted NAD/FAD-dependent oxidoreductase
LQQRLACASYALMNAPENRSSSSPWSAPVSVETPLGQEYLWDRSARIGVCGDWCLGARVEAAYDSGVALARAVLEPS